MKIEIKITHEIKTAITITPDKKKSPKSQKTKTQSNSQKTNIIINNK